MRTLIFVFTFFLVFPCAYAQDFDRLRENMVKDQIEKRGINDKTYCHRLNELGEFPNEEEQTTIYSKLSSRIYPSTITIRVYDIGETNSDSLILKNRIHFLD